ncbi:hypothetical protein DB346_00745 [Verrucomicrobia bacterium LW23]|nr:hypothetical protein DB346_00745 [Verrucomicrobia bacterium LW23]
MNFRSVTLGLLFGLCIPVLDVLNNGVLRQSIYLIGNQLPLGVFGVVALMLLVWNPLIGRLRGSWVLNSGEIVVAAAIALAVCGWPGSNFMRMFATGLAMPSHYVKTKASWQSANVMSYLPGGSPLLAEGFVIDWHLLASALEQEPPQTPGGDVAGSSAAARFYASALPANVRDLLSEKRSTSESEAGQLDATEKARVITAINAVLSRDHPELAAILNSTNVAALLPDDGRKLLERRVAGEALTSRETQILNRLALETAIPGAILPWIRGQGVLLNNGESDPAAVDTLIQGSDTWLGLTHLPWGTWWPSLRLWAGCGLTFAIASMCMALIVHPQWSQRELLAYPVARFVDELCHMSPGGRWPIVATSRLFWCGLGCIAFVHLLNGLNAWFPAVLKIPLQLDFDPLRQLFPYAAKIQGAADVFTPRLFPTIIAFAFFLRSEVSLSLGLVGFTTLAVGGFLLAQGIPVAGEALSPGKFSLMTFGGYIAFAAMLLYVGRSYYLSVAGGVVGLRRSPEIETPAGSIWAGRGLLACVVTLVAIFTSAGMDWVMSTLLVGMILTIFFVLARIYTETGALMIQCGWAPTGILAALMGAGAIGPVCFLVTSIGCIMILADTRETWIGYLCNGLKMAETSGKAAPARMAPWLLLMLIAGLAVSVGAKFMQQYNRGLDHGDRYGVEWMPAGPMNNTSAMIAELSGQGELAAATQLSGLERLLHLSPQPEALFWAGMGGGLVFLCYIARLRLSWWPLHPVLFLVWGTWAGCAVTISFLLGWMIKAGVMKTGGAQTYNSLKPLMVGVIVGELLMALAWAVIGAGYYAATGLTPSSPLIFP